MPSTLLSSESQKQFADRLAKSNAKFTARFPGESGRRQPVHTVYGGGHLFKADTAGRLGQLARASLEQYASTPRDLAEALALDPTISDRVYQRVKGKLEREAVEDFRIDFEDGYGNRPDDEEDGHARQAANEVATGFQNNTLPPFIGIRIKPFTEELRGRSLRTLDVFLSTLLEKTGNKLPNNFVVTLPKIVHADQVIALADMFDAMEKSAKLPPNTLVFEFMVETPQSIIGTDGICNLPRFLDAARGRCVAAHFGVYDYTASCTITAQYQGMTHPACDFARHVMQVAFAQTGVWLSDGATNIMPVPIHRAAQGQQLTQQQTKENRDSVWHGWKLHYDQVRHSLRHAYYQGWDLHPAQLPTRYAAVYAFFLESLDQASDRLRNFIDKAAKATLIGDVFDDAATGQGLLNFFLRAMNSGAITENEAEKLSGLTIPELRSASFVKIIRARTR